MAKLPDNDYAIVRINMNSDVGYADQTVAILVPFVEPGTNEVWKAWLVSGFENPRSTETFQEFLDANPDVTIDVLA